MSKYRKLDTTSLWNRFWDKVRLVNPMHCWEWQGTLNWAGYGLFWLNGTNQNKAHRIAWTLIFGEIPQDTCVLHTCDNVKCVNPYHLWLGTQADNCADMGRKGRRSGSRGAANFHCKLNRNKVLSIRSLRAQGVRQKDIASIFDIMPSTVGQIVHRKTWRYINKRDCGHG